MLHYRFTQKNVSFNHILVVLTDFLKLIYLFLEFHFSAALMNI